jgi:hypothetical protein
MTTPFSSAAVAAVHSSPGIRASLNVLIVLIPQLPSRLRMIGCDGGRPAPDALRHEGWASPVPSAGMIRIRFEGCALSPADGGAPPRKRIRFEFRKSYEKYGERLEVCQGTEAEF